MFSEEFNFEAEYHEAELEIQRIKSDLLKKCDEIKRNETAPTRNAVCGQNLYLGITDTQAASVHDASGIMSTYLNPPACYVSSISDTDKILLTQRYEKNHIAFTCGASHEIFHRNLEEPTWSNDCFRVYDGTRQSNGIHHISLQESVIEKNESAFEQLLRLGNIDLSPKDVKGNTVLHLIVKMNSQEKQSEFLEILRESRNMQHIKIQLNEALFLQKDVKGETALHILTRNGDVKMINLFLEISGSCTQALVNCQDLLDKKTPVILASEENRWELVKFLFSKGADLNIGTRSNKKPIHYACLSNNIGMVKWLFEHGAEPNQRLNNGSNEKNMTADVDIKNEIEAHMKKARNARAKLKRKQKSCDTRNVGKTGLCQQKGSAKRKRKEVPMI